ncbi:hypothetical protein CRM22_008645 [Opisthorchis felineus]|uniref:DNA polymerase n=1 Tax=Opisthorchis felineus TaxID=147828 RepID=A0A4S2LA73_OPIFE|nr:hypothetical protein CRM22_008645 [Opisthorchis felineus]
MTPEGPILCIKLFYLDYYFSKPLTDIDNSYSDLRGSYASKLPVIRIYGTTPSGQKVCANVHGYLPHLFVELPERLDSTSPQCDFFRAFCASLEKAIRSRTRDFAADDMLVFGATLVQGRSIYGFRPREGAFLKVYLLDPSLLIPCAEVLASGHVMDRHFEALEVHVPFLLKFCVDYNLYGMNYMRAKYFRARGDISVCVDTTVCSSVDGTYLCHPATHVGDQLLPSNEAARHTSTEVEVDISVQDILNRAELAGCSGLNPGLEALWSEERARRISNQFGSKLPETPTPDELLPLTKDGSFPVFARERALRDRWTQLIARLGGESLPSISDDFIARWLEQSHDEDEEREPTQTSQPLMEFSSAASGQSRAVRLNSSSTQDALSTTSVDELKRIASVTEDADASLMFPDKELPWGFLKCSLEWSEAARSSLHGSSVFSQLSVRSSQETRELGSFHRSKITSDESQDLANSPLSVSDHDTLRIVDSPRSEHTFLDDEGAEATLLSCATRSAIQYVLCHGSNGDDFVLEQNDADTIKHLVAADEEGICVADEVIPGSNDSGDVQECCEREQTLKILPPPNFGSGTCLERIEESDEEISPPEDLDGELFFGPLSPWSIHSDAGDEPVPMQSEHLTFSPSQSLFDSLALDEHEECVQKAPKEPRISQLDGTEDDIESTQGHVRPERGRRRRLGMRLTTSRTNIRPSKVSGSELSLVTSRAIHQGSMEVQSSSPGTDASHFDQTPSNTSVRASPAAKQADDAVTQFTPRPVDKLNISPVVLMEKLHPALLHSAQSEPLSNLHLNRLSPRDEFEDLIVPISPINQMETTPVPSGIQSFHPLDDALSSQVTTVDEPLSFNVIPGHLTLYSQTQYSPTPGSSSFPTPQMEVDPLPVPVPTYPETPLWRPSIPPPSVSSVNRWLQKCSTPLRPTPSDITPVHHDVENSSNSSTDSEIILNITANPNPQEGLTSVNSASQDDLVSSGQPSDSTQPHDISLTARRSSVTSVSMMYQAASQRCFLPVQTDHTTVASLELHCRSRLVNARGRPNAVDSSQNGARSQTNAPMCRGLLPNAKLDPIILACLTFRVPSNSREKCSHSRRNLFVLVNTTEMPKLDTTNLSPFKWPGPFRFALTSYLDGLSSAKDAAISSASKAASSKQHTASSRTLRARFIWCESEWNLLSWVVYLLQWYDPDLLIGYDVERYSWGYLVQRASYLNRHHYPRELSRLAPDIPKCLCCGRLIAFVGQFVNQSGSVHLDESTLTDVDRSVCCCPCRLAPVGEQSPSKGSPLQRFPGWPPALVSGRTGGQFPCPGRVVLCLWRIVMSELNLYEYSLETVVLHLLKEPVPKFGFGQLHQWFYEIPGMNRWRTVDYWCYRSLVNHRIIEALDLIGRTSEFARVFGIEFFHVLSRGSQYRVESLLCRTAHAANFLLASPSVTQRARQRAPEAIPLNLEPDSRLFVDGPVAVLDFQSLYPSIMIAYNYCYSTCLGRLSSLEKDTRNLFEFGCLTHSVSAELLQTLEQNVNIAPNGVVFVKKSISEGILPCMLKQLLSTRLMVKDSMKLYKEHRSLNRLLDARQLGLKLMANVIFGYTAASFSGRMPCVEVGDSIVSKARETLEQAIQLVDSGTIELPHRTTPRVVYGDTDSLFIHLPGLGKLEAFEVAHAIANAITSLNPAPIKLKMEKIYYPCLLEARKRYAGYAYESPTQIEPVFDAKGIETVRRDGCPFVGKVVDSTLRLLFNQFPLPPTASSAGDSSGGSTDIYSDVRQHLLIAESRVRDAVRHFSQKLMDGRVPFADFILTRPYWGMTTYKPGNFAPALQVASSNQRCRIASGRGTNQTSGQSLAHLDSFDSQSSSFSQTSVVSGGRPLRRRRQSAIMRAFVTQSVRVCPSCGAHLPHSVPSDAFGNCKPCLERNPKLTTIEAVRFGSELRRTNQLMTEAERICTGCLGNRGGSCDPTWLCMSIHCPAHSQRLSAASSLASFWSKHRYRLTHVDTSW